MLDNKTIEITELPVKVWTQAYKELVIEPAVDDKEKGFKGPIPLSRRAIPFNISLRTLFQLQGVPYRHHSSFPLLPGLPSED